MKACLLRYVHELTDDSGHHDEEKLIGVFSSAEKAEDTIQKYKNLERFREYPESCFEISAYEMDTQLNWKEGFSSVRRKESEE